MKEAPLPIQRAIDKAGSDQDFMRIVGVGRRLFFYWKCGKRQPSVDYTLTIERTLGVTRHELRPDLWPTAGSEAHAT